MIDWLRRICCISIFCLYSIVVTAQWTEKLENLEIPSIHEQIILVVSSNWQTNKAKLISFVRNESSWVSALDPIDVVIGKNGMSRGRGLHSTPEGGLEKREGDGKSPAGIFLIGSAFGYDEEPEGIKFDYRKITNRDYYVDDIESEYYNKWVKIPDQEPNEPDQKWDSFERMKRNDHLYEIGFVVRHNDAPVVKGKGSAIFFHVWRRPESYTAGCTAMNFDDMKELLLWIDESKSTLVIQIPEKDFHLLEFDK